MCSQDRAQASLWEPQPEQIGSGVGPGRDTQRRMEGGVTHGAWDQGAEVMEYEGEPSAGSLWSPHKS